MGVDRQQTVWTELHSNEFVWTDKMKPYKDLYWLEWFTIQGNYCTYRILQYWKHWMFGVHLSSEQCKLLLWRPFVSFWWLQYIHQKRDIGKKCWFVGKLLQKVLQFLTVKWWEKLLKSSGKWPRTIVTMAHRVPMIPPNSINIIWILRRDSGAEMLANSPEIILWCSYASVCSKTDEKGLKYMWYETKSNKVQLLNMKSDKDWNVYKHFQLGFLLFYHTHSVFFTSALSHLQAQMR